MKDFFGVMGGYFAPYKRFIAMTLSLNVLAAVMNVFSFTMLLPILRILFNVDQIHYDFIPWESDMDFAELAENNFYYFSQTLVEQYSPATALLLFGCALSILTLLKTSADFGSAATLMPIRTGIVRDIRGKIYRKILDLPLSFFTEEKKGDILARVSTDVNEVDASITSSLEAVIKNPILIIVYMTTLVCLSWQLTVFTVFVVPLLALGIGKIGKSLKAKSLLLQQKWSEGFSLIEETLGGLKLNNVRASVVKSQKAPLLLGQTVLSRLGKIEIDNTAKVLKITYTEIK